MIRFAGRDVTLLAALLLAAPLGACGGEGKDADGAPSGSGASGSGDDGLFGGSGSDAQPLALEPKSAAIVVSDGVAAPPSVQFEARANGSVVSGAAWSVEGDIAEVDATGLATATGKKGGVVKVEAAVGSSKGSAELSVKLKKTINDAGASSADQALLAAAAKPDPDTQWTYPYDRTVFPRGLAAPELMWNGGAEGDLYRLAFVGQFVDYEFFVLSDLDSKFAMDQEAWMALSESGKGGPLAVKVTRLAAGSTEATVVADHEWTISRADLRGTVYYWANNEGRVVRIKPGASAPDDFLAAAGVPGKCISCHTASADGHTLVLGGDAQASTFDLLTDQVALELGSAGKSVRDWAMPAVSPNGKYVVENNAPLFGWGGGSDGVFDALTGDKIPGKGLDAVWLDMPAFGPSGKHLAFVEHDGAHDLGVYAYDAATNAFTSPKILVQAGSDPSLDCIAFPSVSPTIVTGADEVTGEAGASSTWIVYHRGESPGSLDTRYGPGDLFLASADTPGIEIRLEAANGDAYPFAAGDRDRHLSYEPTFAPVIAGGYAWVVFTSRRTYGNLLTGKSSSVKQLWVAAVDAFPEPGTDPSHPAFWLPGQDLAGLNMRAYWALDPCVQQGDACNADGQCCDGSSCEDGQCGGPKQCVATGGLCSVNGDCCDPAVECLGGECGTPPPK